MGDSSPLARGRVLMIAHHFPPTGGSGSNRALAFGRYLPQYGWTPTVLTPGAAWATNRDDSLLADVPPSMRVIRTRSFEPRPRTTAAVHAGAASQTAPASALRSNLGHLRRFPDVHIGWLPFALAAARRQAYDVAYSSSGPFTSHVLGLVLKRLTRRPWVAELRDGWYRWNRAIFPDYPLWREVLERRLEATALKAADRVVLVTDRMAQAFRCQYARELPPGHFAVVPNGFDPLQFPDEGVGLATECPSTEWELLHAGALYYGRGLGTLLEAAGCVARAEPDFARRFRLTLVGTLDQSARAEIARAEPGTSVQVRGLLDHQSTISAMRGADALLLVANTTPGAEATVPAKLFEYLAVGRPVLAIAPPESATADVLSQTGGGWLAPADDAQAIARVLRQAYTEGARPPDRAAIERFDRRALAGDLARIFDQVLMDAPRRF